MTPTGSAYAGRIARSTILRPGAVWRIPWGLGRGLRVEVERHAPLHVYLGTAELELADYIRRFARPGAIVFDVGSHDAYNAMVFARLTRAPVTSFEFSSERISQMRRNLTLNPELSPRVHILQTYLAEESNDDPRTDTLDSLVEAGATSVPDFVMIDVEGAEAAVLRGTRDLLRDRRPHIVVETHSTALEEQCLEALHEAGYSPAIIDRRQWLREKRGTGHNRWLAAEGNTHR
jgi:tRNA A58 N-methylase Trm61